MKKLSICLIFLVISNGIADDNAPKQFIFLDDWSYDLIDYWVNNGALSIPYVLNQPYTVGEFRSKLEMQNGWTRLMNSYYSNFYGQPGLGKIIIYGRDNLSVVSDRNLPLRKGMQSAPIDDVLLFDNRTKNHYNVAAQVNLLLPHVSLVNRTMTNSEFKDDPLFYGDTREWIFGRINDAYLNINTGGFDFFLGRMDRNWGGLSSYGLILSDNPYSYDHAQVSYTYKRFKFSMIATRLEDLLAATKAAPDSLFESRKFMTAHRFDFSISSRLQFALTEVAIYGGPDRDFEIGFLNPMNYFYVVQRNNGKEISGLWAFDLFYKPTAKLNLFTQFLIDDVVVNNEAGQDDRARYPDRMGINFKISAADQILDGLQTALEYTRIGNRTYQSKKTYENFHYQGKGLGFPTASTERFALNLKYFNLYPAMLKLNVSYQRFGDIRLTDVFMLEKEKFPVGTVASKWDLGFDLRYFLNYWSQFTATLGYENFRNYNHVKNDNRTNFKLILGLHFNLASSVNLN